MVAHMHACVVDTIMHKLITSNTIYILVQSLQLAQYSCLYFATQYEGLVTASLLTKKTLSYNCYIAIYS